MHRIYHKNLEFIYGKKIPVGNLELVKEKKFRRISVVFEDGFAVHYESEEPYHVSGFIGTYDKQIAPDTGSKKQEMLRDLAIDFCESQDISKKQITKILINNFLNKTIKKNNHA